MSTPNSTSSANDSDNLQTCANATAPASTLCTAEDLSALLALPLTEETADILTRAIRALRTRTAPCPPADACSLANQRSLASLVAQVERLSRATQPEQAEPISEYLERTMARGRSFTDRRFDILFADRERGEYSLAPRNRADTSREKKCARANYPRLVGYAERGARPAWDDQQIEEFIKALAQSNK